MPVYLSLVGEVVDRVKSASHERLRILDIGANVGQFGFFASHLASAEVISLEPNPVSFGFLQSNRAESTSWYAVERGVASTEGEATLYYVHGKSAQGSMSKSNSIAELIRTRKPQSIIVNVGPVTSELLVGSGAGSSNVFNLIKIDVEGFELEALRAVRGLKFDYLLIEVSDRRDNGCSVEQLQEVAQVELNLRLEEVWSDRPSGESMTRNILFRSY